MKYTLLEMVQRILESMDSDEVNSYSDTIESKAVANIIKETYWHLLPRLDLPVHHGFFKLSASGDNTKPVKMTIPDDVIDIDYIKYRHEDSNSDTVYDEVCYLTTEEFLSRSQNLKSSETNISSMTISLDGASFEFKYRTDKKPNYYTYLDNNILIFDSYDSSEENTLQNSNTVGYGKKYPVFTMSDSFTPELDAAQFDLLLNEAKSQASIELKQMQNPTSERRARKGFINVQRTKNNLPNKGKAKYRSYGRRV